MRSLRARRVAAAVAAAGIGIVGLSSAGWAAPKAAPASGTTPLASSNGQDSGVAVSASSKALASYWTSARMASALHADVVRSDRPASIATGASSATQTKPHGKSVTVAGTTGRVNGGQSGAKRFAGSTGSAWWGNYWSPPATTTGKVFFSTHNGQNWVCSASIVNSEAKDLLITAGHCVYGSLGGKVPGETWHSNWVFVPDYSYNYRPFGTWYARQLWTKTAYVNNQDEGDDIGAALVWPNNGWNITSMLGGQGIAWNYNSTEYVYDFGYPAEYPFNGESLQECDGWAGYTWWAGAEQLACNFTGGSSGGPWLAGFNGTWGYVNSVNDFTYSWYSGQMFGLYFGDNVGSLYNQVRYL